MVNKKTTCKYCEFKVSVSGIVSHGNRCKLFAPYSEFVKRWNDDPNYGRIAEFYKEATVGQIQGHLRWLRSQGVKVTENVRSLPNGGRKEKAEKKAVNELKGTHCHVCKVNGKGCYPCELCKQDKRIAERRRNEIFEAV